MNLQENIQRIQEVMGIISEVKSSYTVKQIEKGLNKSANDNDITINTSVDNVSGNLEIKKRKYTNNQPLYQLESMTSRCNFGKYLI